MEDRGRRPWTGYALFILIIGCLQIPSFLCQDYYDGPAKGDNDGSYSEPNANSGFDDVVRRHDGYVKGETPTIPKTSFTCSAQPYNPGLYADMETNCQVYHVCFDDRQESFLCGPGTNFNQKVLACDFWYNFDCGDSATFYSANAEIGKVPDQGYRPAPSSHETHRTERPISRDRVVPGGIIVDPPFPRVQPPTRHQPQPPRIPDSSAPRGYPTPRPLPSVPQEVDKGYDVQPPRSIHVDQPYNPRPSFPPVVSPPRVSRPATQHPVVIRRPDESSRIPVRPIGGSGHPDSEIKGSGYRPVRPPPQPRPIPQPSQPVDVGYPSFPSESGSRDTHPPSFQQEHLEPEHIPPPPPPPRRRLPPPPPIQREVVRPPPPSTGIVPPPPRQPQPSDVIPRQRRPPSRPQVRVTPRPQPVFPPADHPNSNVKGGPGYEQPPPARLPNYDPVRTQRPSGSTTHVGVHRPPPPPPPVSVQRPPPITIQRPPPPPPVARRPPPPPVVHRPPPPPPVVHRPPPPPVVIHRPPPPPVVVERQPPPPPPPVIVERPPPTPRQRVRPPSGGGTACWSAIGGGSSIGCGPAPPRPSTSVAIRPQPIDHPDYSIKGSEFGRIRVPPPPVRVISPSTSVSRIKKPQPSEEYQPIIPRPQPPPAQSITIKTKQPSRDHNVYQPPIVQPIIDHPDAFVKGGAPGYLARRPEPSLPILVIPPQAPSSLIQQKITPSREQALDTVHQPQKPYKPTRIDGFSQQKVTHEDEYYPPPPPIVSSVKETVSVGIKRPSSSQQSIQVKQQQGDYESDSNYKRGSEYYPKPEFQQQNRPVSIPSRSSVRQNSHTRISQPSTSSQTIRRPPASNQVDYPFVPGYQPPHQRQVFPHRDNPDHPNESIKGTNAYRPPPPANFQSAASEIKEEIVESPDASEPKPEPEPLSKHGDTGFE